MLKITSLELFHALLRGFRHRDGVGYWFRGHADASWPLLPKAGRKEFYLPDDRDLGRFNAWKHEAFPFFERTLDTDWETLAFAQHHGLATRLLDWTGNPLIAAYFAVAEHADKDGCFYYYYPECFVELKTDKQNQAYLHGAGLITRKFDNRMVNQSGLFTVHCPPDKGLDVKPIPSDPSFENLRQFIIPKELKLELREQLHSYGITEFFIFPEVDSVSRHINWHTQQMISGRSQSQCATTPT